MHFRKRSITFENSTNVGKSSTRYLSSTSEHILPPFKMKLTNKNSKLDPIHKFFV